jgi:hypothetical protein
MNITTLILSFFVLGLKKYSANKQKHIIAIHDRATLSLTSLLLTKIYVGIKTTYSSIDTKLLTVNFFLILLIIDFVINNNL